MNKRIAIIYAKNADEIVNRQAALGSYIYTLAMLLQQSGKYEVTINGQSVIALKQAVQSIHITQRSSSIVKKIIPLYLKNILKDIQLFSTIKKLKRKLLSLEADCILEFYSYGSDVGVTLSKKKDIPLIAVYDAPIEDEYRIFNKMGSFFEKKILKRERLTLLHAGTTVVYSNSVKAYLLKKLQHKIEIGIHQNIDFSRFHFIEEKPDLSVINIGFLGSFLKWHRVDLLLSTFIKLKEQNYPVHLYLLGAGAEFHEIVNQVENSKYKTFITYPGFVDGSELLDYKRKLHIGVMPGSNWYGAPNKIFEYGASKMAVVAVDTPTIKDLFGNEIFLFANNSMDALYDRLKYLCEHTAEIKKNAETLQQKIKSNYSEGKTFSFYDGLIKKHSV